MPALEARDWLIKIDGIGKKAASVLLLFPSGFRSYGSTGTSTSSCACQCHDRGGPLAHPALPVRGSQDALTPIRPKREDRSFRNRSSRALG
jgi:hypothetical protein